MNDQGTAGQRDYAARMLQIEKQREDYYRKLGTPPGCSYDEGCNGRSRQHRLWLQHHHRGAGRPQRARRLGATTEVQ